MRRIALDIETTGLDPRQGHKIVEIGCVELENNYPTGKYWQQYIKPNRNMPEEAFRVHGLTNEFLNEKPLFSKVVDGLNSFLKNSELVIHNAKFDLGFLNYELEQIGKDNLERFKVIDTLSLARKRFPGASNSLDALCRRFNIDINKRKKHGALLDAELLADVFLEMNGGRQQGINLNYKNKINKEERIMLENLDYSRKVIFPSEEEKIQHTKILKLLKNNYW